jgi:hypothetical protein
MIATTPHRTEAITCPIAVLTLTCVDRSACATHSHESIRTKSIQRTTSSASLVRQKIEHARPRIVSTNTVCSVDRHRHR